MVDVLKSFVSSVEAQRKARAANAAAEAMAEHCDERIKTMREIVTRWTKQSYILLHAGEMTAQEMLTVRAVVAAILREIEEI